uniref:Secreted protein n=1 Tax=Rhizophora mucronata TaxID=61149 RepID=A0A2P2Q8A7_RHIMU
MNFIFFSLLSLDLASRLKLCSSLDGDLNLDLWCNIQLTLLKIRHNVCCIREVNNIYGLLKIQNFYMGLHA